MGKITVNGKDISVFKIVRPHYNFSYLTMRELERLSSDVKRATGGKLTIMHDAYAENSEYEIIVGNADRKGVTVTDDRDCYKVLIKGKKVFISGGSFPAVTLAVSEFRKMLKKGGLTDADSVTGSYKDAVKKYDKRSYYTPVFFDDFDGDTIDKAKWNVVPVGLQTSEGHEGRTSVRSDAPDVTYQRDGCLQIHPKLDDKYYYGGMLHTQNIFHFTHGYIEISERVPDCNGVWTSLWFRCSDQSGISRPEIDVNENFGHGEVVAANMHTWPTTYAKENDIIKHTSMDGGGFPTKKRFALDDKKYFDDFHTFGVLWTDKYAKFTCDGDVYVTYPMGTKPTDAECFSKHMYAVISMAVGFKSNGSKLENATREQWENRSTLFVDSFHIYQKKDGRQVNGPAEKF